MDGLVRAKVALNDANFWYDMECRLEKLCSRFYKLCQGEKPRQALIRVYKWTASTDKVLEFLSAHQPNTVCSLSNDPPAITFAPRRDQEIACDYICVEYKQLYLIPKSKAFIKRYTYFEIYYDGHIVSCLMDLPTFHKNGPFELLDMVPTEWAHAKLQIKLWNKLLRPNLEDLDEIADIIPSNFAKPFYKRLSQYGESKAPAESLQYPQHDKIIWPLLTYLHLMQNLPLLPKTQIPCCMINYVCPGKYKDFAEQLASYLTKCLGTDPIITMPLSRSSNYFKRSDERDKPGAAEPYLFLLERINSSQLQEAITDLEQYKRSRSRKWDTHPFLNAVPICVGENPIPNSLVINIHVPKDFVLPDSDIIKSGFLYFGKALYKFRDKYRRQKNRLKKYYQKKKDAIDALLDEQAPSFKQSSLYPLSIWFMVMYGAKNVSKKSLIKSEENNWLQTWIDSWSQEQRTLEDEVQFLLYLIKEQRSQFLTEAPNNIEEWELHGGQFFFKEINGRKHVVCGLKYLEQLISSPSFKAEKTVIVSYLIENKYLSTSKGRNNYNIKVGDKTVSTYAFPCDKLDLQ